MSDLRLEVLTESSAFSSLEGHWEALLARSPEANVYLTRSWAGAWWRAFGSGPRLQASHSQLHVIAVWRGEVLVALAPMLTTQLGAGPARIRMLVGVGHENADFGGLLHDPAEPDALELVLDHLEAELGRGRTVLNLTRLEAEGAFLAAILGRFQGGRYEVREHEREAYPFLDLRALDDPERQVRKLLKRNDVTRRTRRLGELGEVAWVHHRPGQADVDLDEFLRLHDLRWEGRAPSGPFTSVPGRAFLHDASQGLDHEGFLRLSFVTLDGVPIVGRYGTEFGNVYQGMKSGWNPEFKAFGLGHMVVGRLIEQGLADDLDAFDFMRGAGDHKAAWCSGSREVGYWTIGRAGRLSDLDNKAMWSMLRLRYRWKGQPRA